MKNFKVLIKKVDNMNKVVKDKCLKCKIRMKMICRELILWSVKKNLIKEYKPSK